MTEPPIRICYVLSHFHPVASGAERQALAQGRMLVGRGHEVRVVTRRVEGLPRDEIIDGVHVHRWVETSGFGPFFGISFVLGVVRALRRLRPRYDLIHTHQGLWEAISTGFGRDWLRDAPVLVQPAASGYFGEAEELARTKGFPILRRLILRNRHFAAISGEIEAQWRALGVPPGRIVRMASGVDESHFRPGTGPADTPDSEAKRVIFTGRLHPQKNLDLLLDAWPSVSRKTDTTLLLVGDGPDRDRLMTRAVELGVADRVDFVGPVADPAEILRSADVFVLPSVAEGMSNSLLEAMATGLPCLASSIGGNTDLIEDGRSGLLLPADDSHAWASALIRVLDDRPFGRSLGRAARRRIEAEFALPVVVDRYVDLYRGLLRGRVDRQPGS